jgi:hypothetical protein
MFDFDIQTLTKGTGVGNLTMDGLPFASRANEGIAGFVAYYVGFVLAAGETVSFLGFSGAPTTSLLGRRSSTASSANLNNTNINDVCRVIGSGVYLTGAA